MSPGFGSYSHPFIWVLCNTRSGDGSLQMDYCINMSMKQSILFVIQRLGWLTHPTPLKPLGRHLLLVLRANHALFWSWGGTVPAGCLGAIWFYMYFLELWFPFSCQQAWACICWKSLGEEDGHSDGPRQHDPAWPWPQDPVCCHDLHTLMLAWLYFHILFLLASLGGAREVFWGQTLCVCVRSTP